MKIKRTVSDIIFDTFNILFMIILIVATLYPFLHVVFASFSYSSYVIML